MLRNVIGRRIRGIARSIFVLKGNVTNVKRLNIQMSLACFTLYEYLLREINTSRPLLEIYIHWIKTKNVNSASTLLRETFMAYCILK